MLNNRGQAIVIFIILLPVLVLFITYVFDVVSINYEQNKLNNIAIMIDEGLIQNTLKEDTACDLVKQNDKDILCSIKKEEEKVVVELTKRVEGLFIKIIKDDYNIKAIVER